MLTPIFYSTFSFISGIGMGLFVIAILIAICIFIGHQLFMRAQWKQKQFDISYDRMSKQLENNITIDQKMESNERSYSGSSRG